MALYVSQFAKLPHLIKAVTFALTTVLLVALLIAPAAPGSFLVWLTALLSLLLNASAAAILVFELEDIVFPLCRTASYAMVESLGALLLAILYFVSLWMCFNARTFKPNFSWSVAAGMCLLQSFLYAFDFVQYFRVWVQQQRTRAQNLDFEHRTSYGLPI